MRINCPICGERDSREFHYRGSAKLLDRPAPDAGAEAFYDYVYIRENPTGLNRELWFHDSGCRSWIVAERNVTTHEFFKTELAVDAKRGAK
ncbi:MAG: sarcosine oxidase subunit delta [Rhodobacterales bacterium]|jgi:heterotetrameric sarcosine oxidase delta subunit|nr:sarcosine oxidase subunit delta [Pseudomonadota bacterium]MDA1285871.1 sarcosine oxidase subunit delta [Pseudomonadota bacterium]NQW15001.1 sarcosine oxidase subunit delta [Rhodobacter sp.]